MHRFVENNISAFLDGELSGLKKQLVKAHLDSCRECSAKYTYIKSISRSLSSGTCKTKAADDFEAVLRARIEGMRIPVAVRPASHWPAFGLKLAAGALGVMIIVAGTMLLNKPRNEFKLPEASFASQTTVSVEQETPDILAQAASFANLANQTRR